MGRSVPRCAWVHYPPCIPPISGEHFLSESVLKQITGTKLVNVSGLPWTGGESKRVAIKGLTANILCRGHNSILSPLDEAASAFFAAIKNAYGIVDGTITATQNFSFNGFEIEKWFIKVCFGMWEGKMLLGNEIRASQPSPRLWSEVLRGERTLPKRWGMYVQDLPRVDFVNTNAIGIQVYCDSAGDLTGAAFTLAGLTFNMILSDGTFPRQLGQYRPCGLALGRPDLAHQIRLNWIGEPLRPAVCMTLVSEEEVTRLTGRQPPPR